MALLGVYFLSGVSALQAADVLDPGFGSGGIAPSPGFEIRAMARQADGKLVVAGTLSNDFAVARYNTDGTLDNGFGAAGIVQTHVSTMDVPSGVVVQSDGKLVVAGRSSISAAVMIRYASDGTLDSAFGTAGVATTAAYGGATVPLGFALQADGKLLLAGSAGGAMSARTLLARFNANGSVDTGFGTNGRVEGTNSSSMPDWQAVALQADGKILVTGCSARSFGGACSDTSFNIARYSVAGALDSSFGTSGVSTTNFSGSDAAYALAVQADGKILAAGRNGPTTGGNLRDFAVYRYTSAGALDTTFDGDGLMTVDYGSSGDDTLKQMAVLPNGQILAAGVGFNGVDNDGAALLFNANGTLDTGFADSGIFRLEAGGSETLNALAMRNAGSLAALGGSQLVGIVLNDADLDGIPNGSDADDDNDGVLDASDNCQFVANVGQQNLDGDSFGDVCDDDRDGDGLGNAAETASGTNPDIADTDGDGANDAIDIFPLNNAESADNDLDGVGDNADTDDDNDGIPDASDPNPFVHSALDQDFGSGGYTVTPMFSKSEKAFAMLRHNTGKFTLAGSDFTLARFNADGVLDTSFDADGKMLILPNSRSNAVMDLADGRMVAVGSTNTPRGLVYLFKADGSLDTGFSGDGSYTDADSNNVIESVQQQSTGKLLLVGGYTPVLPPLKARITRMNLDGSVDTSFGTNGYAKDMISSCSDIGLGGCPFVSAIQPDDKLVLASTTSVARLNANGSLDASFDGDGKATLSAGTGSRLFAMAKQDDGKFVFAGRYGSSGSYDTFVARLNSNGSLDTQFGDNGYARMAISAGDDQANAVAIQKNGKIVIAGVSHNGSNKDLFVARLHTNGQQDKSYYGNGVAVVDLMSTDQAAYALALDDKDNAVAAGYHGTSPANYLLAKFGGNHGRRVVLQDDGKVLVSGSVNSETAVGVVRYDGNGVVDTSYGNNGKTVTNFGAGTETVDDSLLQQDGSLVVVGTDTATATSTKGRLARYKPDGAADTAFGQDGKLQLDDGAARAVAQQADGKLVTAGRLACGGNYCPGVMRLHPDGSVDTGFGSAGKAVCASQPQAEFLAAAIEPASQKIVAVGRDVSSGDALLVRYLPNGALDGSFGSGGVISLDAGAGEAVLESVALFADGRIAAGGKKTHAGNSDVLVVQRLANGAPDTGFGSNGIEVKDLGSSDDAVHALHVHPAGFLLAAGERNNGTDQDAVVLRFKPDGGLDTRLDGDGVKVVPGNEDEVAEDMVLAPDGASVVVAGASGTPSQFMVATVAVIDTVTDSDGDGIPDDLDAMPNDTDNDGIGNNDDLDDDNDNVPDYIDADPLNVANASEKTFQLNSNFRGSTVSEAQGVSP